MHATVGLTVGGEYYWEVDGWIYSTCKYVLHCTRWVLVYTFDWFIFGFIEERSGRYVMT